MKSNDKFNAIFRRSASRAALALSIVALVGADAANVAKPRAERRAEKANAAVYVENAAPLGTEISAPIGAARGGANAISTVAPAVASSAVYPVATREVSWNDAQGRYVSALVFYPAAPPVAGSKFSVVVYSHGLGGSAERFAYLGESWAARGVVT
ncbi:MAG: hypothetical protein IJ387_02010, partial [Thermoguttaceae bacterium]|nr:hypothetical protein [Thermoguttaceae bacterium]